jgi:glycosyltransferase involved in cell wall biosynthesis
MIVLRLQGCITITFESALSLDAKTRLQKIGNADIIVGVPSYNNVSTASYVVKQAAKGLETYFPNYRSVVFVSDGNSTDGTLDSVKNVALPSQVTLVPAVYVGTSGKGTALKAVFEAARALNAKSVALVDSDLRSITPEWMKLLIGPTLEGTGLVAPYYKRCKYDGTITNFLCYPLTRSLFGKDVRQPIGGDFGLSIGLVEKLLDSPVWSEVDDVNRFGIDIFETISALAEGFKVKQAFLGVKIHDPKDPSSQLAPMFRQVLNTLFTCIENYEPIWKNVQDVSKTEFVGEANSGTPEDVTVSFKATIDSFNANYDDFKDVYNTVLDASLIRKFEQLRQIETAPLDFQSEDWAKTVYSFIAAYHKNPIYGRAKLIDALRVLWVGRVAAFLKDTADDDCVKAEEKIVSEAEMFGKLKDYFIEKY